MKQQHSIGSPTRCETSTIGCTSLTTVRAAQLARIFSFAVDDLARQTLDVAHDVRSGARQADVRRVDADLVEEPKDAQLLVDGRRPNRGRLQSVAQRLVVQHHESAAARSGASRFQS